MSRPLQRGKGKHVGRGDYRSPRAVGRVIRGSWGHSTPPRSLPMRGLRGVGSRIPPASVKRPVGVRDRRPVMSFPPRARPLPPPARSYDRRPPGMQYTLYIYFFFYSVLVLCCSLLIGIIILVCTF